MSRGSPGSECAETPVPEPEGAKGTPGRSVGGAPAPGEAGSRAHAVTGAGESARPGGEVSSCPGLGELGGAPGREHRDVREHAHSHKDIGHPDIHIREEQGEARQ